MKDSAGRRSSNLQEKSNKPTLSFVHPFLLQLIPSTIFCKYGVICDNHREWMLPVRKPEIWLLDVFLWHIDIMCKDCWLDADEDLDKNLYWLFPESCCHAFLWGLYLQNVFFMIQGALHGNFISKELTVKSKEQIWDKTTNNKNRIPPKMWLNLTKVYWKDWPHGRDVIAIGQSE